MRVVRLPIRTIYRTKTDYQPGKPLPNRNTPKESPPDLEPEPITEETIYTCIAAPHPSDIKTILHTLLSTSDVTSSLTTIQTLKSTKGLALADILTALAAELQNLEVPAHTRVAWMEGLADVEWRLAGGGGEVVQTGGLVGVVRGGCELMGK